MNIDRKFKILAVNQVTGSVYTDDNALILCAKDAATPAALNAYLNESKKLGADEKQLRSIQLLIERVAAFQKQNGTKLADITECEAISLLAPNKVDYVNCSSCGYEDVDVQIEFVRTVANGNVYRCPACQKETMGVENDDDEYSNR